MDTCEDTSCMCILYTSATHTSTSGVARLNVTNTFKQAVPCQGDLQSCVSVCPSCIVTISPGYRVGKYRIANAGYLEIGSPALLENGPRSLRSDIGPGGWTRVEIGSRVAIRGRGANNTIRSWRDTTADGKNRDSNGDGAHPRAAAVTQTAQIGKETGTGDRETDLRPLSREFEQGVQSVEWDSCEGSTFWMQTLFGFHLVHRLFDLLTSLDFTNKSTTQK
ncbi:unnamed protein product, partial [Nesidiocoris tenuis]